MTEKSAVRTEEAPAPFQGAPYSQAIRAGDLVFVSGQLALDAGAHEIVGETIEEQTEQVFQNLSAILEAAGSSLEQDRQDHRLSHRPRHVPGHERGLPAARRRCPAGEGNRGGLGLPSGALVEIEAIALA